MRLKNLLVLSAVLFFLSCQSSREAFIKNQNNIEFQEKKTYSYSPEGIYFSNEFASARLNNVTQINDSTYSLLISPENTPINPSPWYAFSVWSKNPQNLYLKINYEGAKHRYNPHKKIQNGSWEEIEDLQIAENKNSVEFKIQSSSKKQIISGQPLFNADSIQNWLGEIKRFPAVKTKTIGKSLMGKKMFAYYTPVSENKKAVLIFGGQHPPEITGYKAQMAFVNFLFSDDQRAVKFRSQYQIIGVPWLNPDGGFEGHWRHTAAGVDLNRDWTTFVQPESQNARDFVMDFVNNLQVDIVFAVDFHSTYHDVYYTNLDVEGKPNHMQGLIANWLEEMQKLMPEHEVKFTKSAAAGRVSKSWFMTDLKAEGVTYEVGDLTSDEVIKYKAEIAVIALINLLLDK